MTAAEVARRVGWYRSNLSAMDAGARGVSLAGLVKVAEVLACSPGDLLDVTRGAEAPLFRDPKLMARLRERDLGAPDGTEKGWVHAAQLAWRRHYGSARRRG